MKTKIMSLGALLMATTALVAPAFAVAQEQSTPAPEVQATEPAPDAAPQEEPKEVIVRGRHVPNTMRRTAEVTSIITREDLVRTGDDNAALALTRVTGLSVVEGKFVYVRGLGERYSSALLNGGALPSPEPLQRVVPLDLFPASILNRVSVQKTYSAEYPAEFGGGVVDLETVAVPREGFLSVGISTGGNSETTFKKGFTHYGSDTDFFGYDDGTRDVPDALRAAIATGKRVNSSNFTPKQLQTIGQSFVNAPLNLIQYTDHLPANFGANIGAGDAYDVWGGRLGVIGIVDFSNNWQSREGINETGQDAGSGYQVQAHNVYSQTNNNASLNGLFGLGFTREGHTVKWTNLYIHRTTKQTRIREGVDENGDQVRRDSTGWYERELMLTQLSGVHPMGDNVRFDWQASQATTKRDAPYEKSANYRVDETPGYTKGLYFFNLALPPATSFSTLEDKVTNLTANVTYNFSLGEGRDGKIVGGVNHIGNIRESERRDFIFRGNLPGGPSAFERIDFVLSDYHIGPGLLELQEATLAEAAYDARLDVDAAYVKADVAVLPLVRVAGGLRYETGSEKVTLRDLFGTGNNSGLNTSIEEDYLLPSATVTWNFAEDMQLRFGGSKTIGRPQFRELALPTYTDPDTNRSYIGNPLLRDTEMTNLDARYEWYYDAGQYFTVGAFAKDIERPVETLFGGSALTQTFVNAPKANLYGVEFDFKKLFDTPSYLNNGFFETKRWLFQANYTYTKSEVQVKDGDKIAYNLSNFQPIEASLYIKDGSRMQGQSDHVANLQFGWDDADARSQATFLVTYVSDRISQRGSVAEPEFIQEPGATLDFTWRKGFKSFGKDVTFSLEARNLTGTEYKEYQEGKERVYVDNYKIGQSVSLSLSTQF
jgi:hypothetical protein